MEVRGGHLKKGFRGRGARPALFVFSNFLLGYKRLFSGVRKFFCEKKSLEGRTAGFTLVELIVVVAISAVVSVGGFMTIYKYRAAQNIKLALNEIVAVTRNTQGMSITQKNGKQWGIRFSNSVADGQSFRTWSGSSFASSSPNQTYKLRSGVNFGNPATGKDIDVIFSAISGEISQNQIITLLAGSAGSMVGDVVVNTLGKVTTRKEEGLVGYWHFDEGTSTIAYDMSGYENNGTLTNSPTWQSGIDCKSGGCLSFDGTNNYVELGINNMPSGALPRTLSVWANVGSSNSGYRAIFNEGTYAANQQFQIGILSGSFNVNNYSATWSDVATYTTGQWYHLVLTYDGSNVLLYKNGGVVASATGITLNTTIGKLRIGANPNAAEKFNGSIDEVRVYNRVLSADEILQMYNDIK